jgi:hypothetical protein
MGTALGWNWIQHPLSKGRSVIKSDCLPQRLDFTPEDTGCAELVGKVTFWGGNVRLWVLAGASL